jgi:hypothetical protein
LYSQAQTYLRHRRTPLVVVGLFAFTVALVFFTTISRVFAGIPS